MISEKTFQSIFNNAVDGILLVNIEHKRIEMANEVFCEKIGYSEEELKTLSFGDLHSEEDLSVAVSFFNSQASGTLPNAKDVPFRRKDGNVFYVDINAIKTSFNNNNYLIAILRDVNQRKKIADELSFKTTLLETQLETAIDGILVVDDQANILLYNRRFADMWEMPQSLLDSKNDSLVLQYGTNQMKDPEEFKRKVTELYSQKDQKSRDEIEFKDGRIFDRYSSPLIGKNGKLFGRIWYFRDVSESKKTEQALRKSEETFRLVTESTNDAIWDWNLETMEVFRNSRYATMLGHKPSELTNSQDELDKRIHPEDKPRMMQIVNELFQGKRESIEYEFRMRHKSGKYIWILSRGKVVERDEKGNPVRLVGTNIDITSRKEIEERFLRLNKAIEQSSEGIIITDLEPRVLYTNKAWAEMHGFTTEEAIGIHIDNLQTNEHKETYEKAVPNILSPDGWTGETSHKRKDGSVFPIQMSVSVLRNEKGEPSGFISVSRDITELKKTQNALIESELRYRTLVENATVDIGSIDKDGRILLVNKKAAERFVGKPEDVIGKTIWDLFPKEFADPFYKTILDVIENNQGINVELSPEIEGTKSIHDTSIEPLILPNSSISSVMIISHEITDRKEAEQALIESEEKYRVLVENAGEAIVVINEQGEHIFVNSTAAQRLGATPEEVIGKTLWDLFPREIADIQNAEVNKVIKTNQGTTIVTNNTIKDETFWYEVTIQPLVTNTHTIALIISRDITERKKIENALIESEERYRALVEGANETIAVLNKEGVFQFMNTTAAKRLGGKPEDYIGKSMWDVFPKEIADRQAGSIKKVVDTGECETFINQTVLRGNTCWYETTIAPLRNKERQVYAGLIIGRDITTIKNAQNELETYREEVAHAERLASLGTLSATAAHELTQPLTVVRLLIENAMTKLQQTTSPELVVKKLRESLTEISNITSVVDRLRNFARKSTEKTIKEIDLKTIARRIINLLVESSLHSGVKFYIEDMDELPKIYSIEKDIEQMFFALLDNAMQAAGDLEGKKIVISGSDLGEYVELRFADNCSGIAPENIERIFEPFFTTKPPNKGTGLGLCIVKDIVLRAGGKIRVESEMGRGSTFFVTLPLNQEMN